KSNGVVTQVMGPVVDVRFEGDSLPEILNALTVKLDGKEIVLEVSAHLGTNEVRTIAMTSTDGLKRGEGVVNTGAPISVPVGPGVLGRMFDVVGSPIDEKESPKVSKKY